MGSLPWPAVSAGGQLVLLAGHLSSLLHGPLVWLLGFPHSKVTGLLEGTFQEDKPHCESAYENFTC